MENMEIKKPLDNDSSGRKPAGGQVPGKEHSTGDHQGAAPNQDVPRVVHSAEPNQKQPIEQETQASSPLGIPVYPQHPLMPQVLPTSHGNGIQGNHGVHMKTSEILSVHQLPFGSIPGPPLSSVVAGEQINPLAVGPMVLHGGQNNIGSFIPHLHTMMTPPVSNPPAISESSGLSPTCIQERSSNLLCTEVSSLTGENCVEQNASDAKSENQKHPSQGFPTQQEGSGCPPYKKEAPVPDTPSKEEPKAEASAQIEQKRARDPDAQCEGQQENLSDIPLSINTNLQPISSLERLGVKPGKRVLIRPKEWAGEVVWAKLARDPWWPAQVLGENDPFIPQDADPPRLGAVPVRFFGTYDFAWIETQRSLTPFLSCFHDRSLAVDLKEFIIGVNEALDLQHTGKLPQGFADAMEDAKPVPVPRGRAKSKPIKESGVKRPQELICPEKVPAVGRKDKVMRLLGLAPPNGSPYATTRAVNPNILHLSQNGDAYHC